MAIYSGFSHQKWWFSLAMLTCQRVVVDFWSCNIGDLKQDPVEIMASFEHVLPHFGRWVFFSFLFFSMSSSGYSWLGTWAKSPFTASPLLAHHHISGDFGRPRHEQDGLLMFTQHHPKLNLQNCRPIAFLATLMFAQLPRAMWLLSCGASDDVDAKCALRPVSSAIELLDSDEESGRKPCRTPWLSRWEKYKATRCSNTLLDTVRNVSLDPTYLM